MAEQESKLTVALLEVGEAIQANKVAKGWTVTTAGHWECENQIPADLCLIHSEVSEALEAFRKSDLSGFTEELADVFIRVVGLAHGMGIDLGEAVEAKVAKNRDRPVRHGGKKL